MDNDDVYAYVNRLARQEELDLEVRLLDTTSDDWLDDRESLGVEKIHNKGLIIDSRVTLFSSINGVENSFKGNREVAVLVTSPTVAHFYERLFWYDWTTVLAPDGLEALGEVGAPEEAELNEGPEYTGVVLKGLKPSTKYYLRVSSFDSDDTDFENTRRPTPMGPHESALSDELAATSSPKGTLALRWKRNRSECLEEDLAGYRVYYSKKSVPGTVTPRDIERKGLYKGKGARRGASPITIEATGVQPQCKAMLEAQPDRDPKPVPECDTLVRRVEQCFPAASKAFPKLAKVLGRSGPPGSARFRRTMDALSRSCAHPPFDSIKYWVQEREECSKVTDCKEFFKCLRRVEAIKHRQILRSGSRGPWGGKGRGGKAGPGGSPGHGAVKGGGAAVQESAAEEKEEEEKEEEKEKEKEEKEEEEEEEDAEDE